MAFFSAQSQRSLKLLTGVASAGALVQGVFFAEYNIEGMEGKDHVFTHIRSETRQWIDSTIYGYNKNPDDNTTDKKQRKQKKKKKDNIAASGDTTNGESSSNEKRIN
eukprot:CAMPEP_0113452686 /NCGR_PEP_ID=MMETSP0014_2-20120614/6973_1 /TAXON_ID=2857 /ORGANISM="Nitzschia sp." /LENGTH=106 /DNA_ID=CAMNT_0000344063 /DNA_START=13 /DNA_END=333 /DNA_ORIENTATION=+ /assembly_acc=CAM_ASM_000159